jgi:hypothetical protein
VFRAQCLYGRVGSNPTFGIFLSAFLPFEVETIPMVRLLLIKIPIGFHNESNKPLSPLSSKKCNLVGRIKLAGIKNSNKPYLTDKIPFVKKISLVILVQEAD